jgi:hypothetical protein
MLFRNVIPGASVFRRADWERIGGFTESNDWGEDWEFWLRVLAGGGKGVVIHEALYDYRQHAAQTTATMPDDVKMRHHRNIVTRNTEIFGEHVEYIMSEFWRQEGLLRSLRRRFGWANGAVSQAVDFSRAVARRRARG